MLPRTPKRASLSSSDHDRREDKYNLGGGSVSDSDGVDDLDWDKLEELVA